MKTKHLAFGIMAISAIVITFNAISAEEDEKPKLKQVSVKEIDKSIQLIGLLNKPLGQFMTIEAVFLEQSKGHDKLRVTQIDGTEITPPIEIPFFGDTRGKKPLESGKTYRFRGYESAGYVGLPRDSKKEGVPLMQTYSFHFMSSFESHKWQVVE